MLALAAVVLMSAAGPLIRGIYGREFLGAVRPLMLLVPGVVAWGAGRILAQFISYNAGRPHLCTVVALVGAVLNIAGNLYSIPRWGLSGAAVASSLSYAATFGLMAVTFVSLKHQGAIQDATHVSGV
jgi:O-antigen/teichoic acid export membrane protein